MTTLGFLQGIGTFEWLVILGLALLLFGRRLPEVGRSLGRGIVEFKKGLKGIEDEIEDASKTPPASTRATSQTLPSHQPAVRLEPPASREGQEVRVSRAEPVE